MDLKATVETPSAAGEEPLIEEIPLPPENYWQDLENSKSPDKAAADEAAPAQSVREPAAALRFIGGKNVWCVPLQYPFEYNDREVREIEVRKLTLAQVSELLDAPEGQSITTFSIYAIMTGFPVAVLRGLIDEDARKVVEVAYDFLPPTIRTVFESTAI